MLDPSLEVLFIDSFTLPSMKAEILTEHSGAPCSLCLSWFVPLVHFSKVIISFILCRTETVQLVKDIINKLKVLVFLSIMSCYVIVRNRLSLSMGSQNVAAGVNPSLVSGRGQGTPQTSLQFIAGPH